MDFKARTLTELRARRDTLASKRAFVGLDGFVDTIVAAVAQRAGPGDDFTPFVKIADFGQRILGASGKSTNIEFHPRLEKLGGNGPIMANALLAQGAAVTYVGALGRGAVEPVFNDFARRATVVTLCEAARTTAVEFSDGKLMLGTMRCLDEITPERITAALGGVDCYRSTLAAADLVALVNWTMIPQMSAVFADLLDRVLPQLPSRPDRAFFFDLADPEKRSAADLLAVLGTIARFEQFGRVTLGLNLKEAQQVFSVLGFASASGSPDEARQLAEKIRARLDVSTVVVHPKESAACATRDGLWWIPGPYVAQPKISTGAGDHFNGGFSAAQLMGLSPEACLGVGVCTSGHYVRTAESPTLDQLETFLANWR